MKTYRVIVTNDDGPHSPFLESLTSCIDAQTWCNSILPVFPAEEKSWIGTALTRFKELKAAQTTIGNQNVFLVDGTPADCASLACHNLNAGIRPDFLISGINMGTNAGLPFFLCSGTVGACVQAFLNGIKSVAISCNLPNTVYKLWTTRDERAWQPYAADFERISQVAIGVVSKLIRTDAWKHADYFTINLPWESDKSTRIRLTSLARAQFKALFENKSATTFRHCFQGFENVAQNPCADKLPTDFEILEKGEISLSAIRYQLDPKLPQELIDLL